MIKLESLLYFNNVKLPKRTVYRGKYVEYDCPEDGSLTTIEKDDKGLFISCEPTCNWHGCEKKDKCKIYKLLKDEIVRLNQKV